MSNNDSLQLSYVFTCEPQTIRASAAGANPNTVNLKIIISNPSLDSVTLDQITIGIPVGQNDAKSLSTASSLTKPAKVSIGPWVVDSSASTVTITAATAKTLTFRRDPLVFTLPGIEINEKAGSVPISVTESAGQNTTSGNFSLAKLDADFPVTKFYADPPFLLDYKPVKLYWQCSDQGKNFLYSLYRFGNRTPDCRDGGSCYRDTDGQKGISSGDDITETTTFVLDVLSPESTGGYSVHASLHTTVKVEVPKFAGDIKFETALLGRVIKMGWIAHNAKKCVVQLDGEVLDDNAPANTYDESYDQVISVSNGGNHKIEVIAHSDSKVEDVKQFPEFTTKSIDSIPFIPELLFQSYMAMTPDGTTVLACCANNVSVFDITNRVFDRTGIQTGNLPANVCIKNDSKLAVIPWYAHKQIIFADIPTRTSSDRFDLPFDVMQLAMTPDATLAVSVNFSSEFAILDLANRKVESKVTMRASSWRIQLSPDGKYAAPMFDDNIVSVYNLKTGKFEEDLYVPGAHSFTPDSKKLLLNRGSNLGIYDLETKKEETIALPGEQANWPAKVTPDGRFALVANNRSFLVVDLVEKKLIPGSIPTPNVNIYPVCGGTPANPVIGVFDGTALWVM